MSCHHSEIKEDVWGYLQNAKCSALNLTVAFGKSPGDDYAGKDGRDLSTGVPEPSLGKGPLTFLDFEQEQHSAQPQAIYQRGEY